MTIEHNSIDDRTNALRVRAERLRDLARRQARRAFVVELAGTPKAGKSTSVNLITSFFKDCGFRVHLLKERAADCPLPMKGHFFFNTWTTCSMLSEVLATVDTDADLLILDRGLFDALMWLELQQDRRQITDQEYRVFSEFVRLERWRNLVDVTFVMAVKPEIAMKREDGTRLLRKQGSIMNPGALSDLNRVLEETAEKYHDEFRLFRPPDQTDDVMIDNCALVQIMLDALEKWADPEILAAPRSILESALGKQEMVLRKNGEATAALQQIAPSLVRRQRSQLEEDREMVQLVGCGLLRNAVGEYFLLKRSEKDKKSEAYGRYTLWKGCHLGTTKNDLPQDADRLTTFASGAVVSRIREDFHLALSLDPELRAVVWNPKEQHCGLLFDVPIVDDQAARNIREKEFRKQGRFETHSAKFMPRDKVRNHLLELEPWSRAMLNAEVV